MKYAEVVVDTPVRRRITPGPARGGEDYNPLAVTFHYSIPPRLASEVTVGQLIKVPFGSRHLQGIVVALTDTSPVAETKDIEEVLEPKPVLSPIQIELARWISSYYLAPLRNCLRLMLPPGLARRAKLMVQLEEALPDDLSGEEQAAVRFLRRRGKVELESLDRELDVPDARALVDGLERRGVLVKRWELAEPQVKPKRERFVRLVADGSELEDKLTGLHRLDVYTSILDFLKVRGDLASVSEVYAKTDSSLYYLRKLAERGLVRIEEREVWREPLAGREFVLAAPPKLTPDQEAVWQEIEKGIENRETRVYLLHGVTGSGKTEIYLRALQEVLARGRQAIVMVPEISLTPQTIRRFAARFPARLAVLHSKLSSGERYDEWRRIRAGRADVVIGPRSAIFAPFPRLGLIVVDEEHSSSYKQERTPHYHAHEVAVKLAELSGSVVILGSATPDLVSYHRAQRGKYKLLCLPKRIMGHRRRIEEQKERYRIKVTSYKEVGEGFEDARYLELPPVQVVDMRQELKAGNRSIFSRALQRAMGEALDRKQQVILFLNRRGAATFVMCRDCGHVLKCPRCEVPLTYHAAGEALVCHHCNCRYPAPNVCPNCGSYRIKYFGVGTQRVEATVQSFFPGARTLRWDRDTTGGKLSHEELLAGFIDQEADVLVGTQMIAKGLDLPLVTLVGVVSADTALHLPDFRAAERTFQLLTQVAGRAGRSILGGKVIVQTYTPEHYSIRMASQHNYQGFYERELKFRRQQGYPPFNRLAKLVYFHSNRERCRGEAERVHRILTNRIARLGLPSVDLIGPAPCFFSRLRGKYRWQIVVRAPKPQALLKDVALSKGWRVDIDPLNTL